MDSNYMLGLITNIISILTAVTLISGMYMVMDILQTIESYRDSEIRTSVSQQNKTEDSESYVLQNNDSDENDNEKISANSRTKYDKLNVDFPLSEIQVNSFRNQITLLNYKQSLSLQHSYTEGERAPPVLG